MKKHLLLYASVWTSDFADYFKTLAPVLLKVLSLRFLSIPFNLYGTYENLRLEMFSETDTWSVIAKGSTIIFSVFDNYMGHDLELHAIDKQSFGTSLDLSLHHMLGQKRRIEQCR